MSIEFKYKNTSILVSPNKWHESPKKLPLNEVNFEDFYIRINGVMYEEMSSEFITAYENATIYKD